MSDTELLKILREIEQLTQDNCPRKVCSSESQAKIDRRRQLQAVAAKELVRRNSPILDAQTQILWYPSDCGQLPAPARQSWMRSRKGRVRQEYESLVKSCEYAIAQRSHASLSAVRVTGVAR